MFSDLTTPTRYAVYMTFKFISANIQEGLEGSKSISDPRKKTEISLWKIRTFERIGRQAIYIFRFWLMILIAGLISCHNNAFQH